MTTESDFIGFKCITFDKEVQNNLPEHIKAKMKANQDRARQERDLKNTKQ